MANENEISIRQFARHIHVSEGAVRKAIKDKKIVNGYDKEKGKIIFSIAYAEYGQAKTSPKAGHGVSKKQVAEKLHAMAGANFTGALNNSIDANADSDGENFSQDEDISYEELLQQVKVHSALPYNEAIRLNEILSIAKEKVKLQETLGTLVNKNDIDKQLYALGSELKQHLQNIPNRVVSLMRTAPNEVEAGNILLKEINQVLESFTNNI